MLRLALVSVLLAASASAQDASPLGLTNVVGYSWNDVSSLVSQPDSGAVTDGVGDLAWFDLDQGVDRMDAQVRYGSIAFVTLTDASDEHRAQLTATVEQYTIAMGPPGDGNFYTASQIRSVNPNAPYLDIAFDVEAGQTLLRKPQAPPPPAPGN